MAMETERGSVDFQFGEYVLRPDRRALLHFGHKVEIGFKPFEVLVCLILNRERAISRRELYESVWGLPWLERSSANTVDVTVGRLRKALGETRDDRRFIETVHGTFRFIAQVTENHNVRNGNGNGPGFNAPAGCDSQVIDLQATPERGALPCPALPIAETCLAPATPDDPGGVPAPSPVAGRYVLPLQAPVSAEISAAPTLGPAVALPSARPKEVLNTWRMRLALLTGALVLLGASGLAYMFTSWLPRGPVADFRVSGREVIAYNQQGQELWRYLACTQFEESWYGQARWRHAWLGDLMGEGRPGLLLTVQSPGWPGVPRSLIYLDHTGKRRWRFVPGWAVRDAGGSIMEPPYGVGPVQVVPALGRTERLIVVSSYHWLEQADQVAVLSSSGAVLGEYWHPGHLLHVVQADLDGSGWPKVLLGGVNNGNHQATLVILDPWAFHGRSTPVDVRDQNFRLLDMPPAKEWAVILFPRSCFSHGQPYTRVQHLQIRPDRIDVDVVEGPGENVHPNFVYEFDYQLHVIKVLPAAGNIKTIHDEMQARHELDHEFSMAELDHLKAGVIVRR